jgi:hypothetical protein
MPFAYYFTFTILKVNVPIYILSKYETKNRSFYSKSFNLYKYDGPKQDHG